MVSYAYHQDIDTISKTIMPSETINTVQTQLLHPFSTVAGLVRFVFSITSYSLLTQTVTSFFFFFSSYLGPGEVSLC